MRVLNVNFTLDFVTGGGSAERTFQMSRHLARVGSECYILTLDLGPTSGKRQDPPGVEVVALPSLVQRYFVPALSLRRIRTTVKKADIVHLMSHWALINALVYFFARRLDKPYVVCPAGSLPIYGRSKNLKRLYNWLIGKKIISNANGYIAINPDEVSQFKAYGVDPSRVSVIPNGIDPDEYLAGDEMGFRRGYGLGEHPLVLFVGRLNPIKGPDLLLQAFCRAKGDLPDHHLAFVGPDEGLLSELRRIAADGGVEDRVHFLGHLGGATKSQAYYASDLLVIPSRQEAMSIVALEAGITGTPVLLTDQCGFDEVADVGGGQVVPASVEGLQSGLTELLKDPARLRLMGASLRELVRDRYTWDSMIGRYLTLYDGIIKNAERH